MVKQLGEITILIMFCIKFDLLSGTEKEAYVLVCSHNDHL